MKVRMRYHMYTPPPVYKVVLKEQKQREPGTLFRALCVMLRHLDSMVRSHLWFLSF